MERELKDLKAAPLVQQETSSIPFVSTYFRIAFIFVCTLWAYSVQPETPLLWGTLLGYLLWSAFATLALHLNLVPTVRVPIIASVDIVAVSYVVYGTGPQDNVLPLLYLPIIVAFAVQKRTSIVLLLLIEACLGYTAVLLIDEFAGLPHAPLVGGDFSKLWGSAGLSLFVVSVTLVACVSVILRIFLRLERAHALEKTLRVEAEHERAKSEKLQQRINEMQRLESLGRLAGGVAHDFNNMLTGISGYSNLVLEELGPDDPLRDDLGEVIRAADRGSALTSQLLAFSRRQTISKKLVDLGVVLTDFKQMLARIIGGGIEISYSRHGEPLPVEVDPGQIEQIVMNLGVNARDAMTTGGQLCIEAGKTTLDQDFCSNHGDIEPGEYVWMAFRDQGSGMNDDVAGRVFEPFFTTKPRGKGTGLGLSTVYGIVRQHNGAIQVDTREGEGSCFRIYLPLSIKKAQTQARSTPPKAASGELILVVEDEDLVRKITVRLLERAGYRVIGAASGEEGLQRLQELGTEVDLLLTDVVMPGMSGRELADAAQRQFEALHILFMSGYADDELGKQGVLEPRINFLHKPFATTELLNKVRDILAGHGMTQHPQQPHSRDQ